MLSKIVRMIQIKVYSLVCNKFENCFSLFMTSRKVWRTITNCACNWETPGVYYNLYIRRKHNLAFSLNRTTKILPNGNTMHCKVKTSSCQVMNILITHLRPKFNEQLHPAFVKFSKTTTKAFHAERGVGSSYYARFPIVSILEIFFAPIFAILKLLTFISEICTNCMLTSYRAYLVIMLWKRCQ